MLTEKDSPLSVGNLKLSDTHLLYNMNFTLSAFTPPKGTTVTRPMTYAERKLEGRKGYARHILSKLLELRHWAEVNDFKAKGHGTKIVLSFKGDRATINFQYSNGSTKFSPIVCPLYDKGDGTFTLDQWLTDQDPCLGARLLKNGRKQILDRKSREGEKKKQTYTEPHSPMEIDEFI